MRQLCECVRGTLPNLLTWHRLAPVEGISSDVNVQLMPHIRIVWILLAVLATACSETEDPNPDGAINDFRPGASVETETYLLRQAVSKTKTIEYKRVIAFDPSTGFHHVRDFFENGQPQMEGTYSAFDKQVKESFWCNHRSNVKDGVFRKWYEKMIATLRNHSFLRAASGFSSRL